MPALYLVRHGEPAITGVLLGRTDPPLSDQGRIQAASLELDADVFYTSSLRRSLTTAELCSNGRPLVVLAELCEIDMGEWEGLRWADIELRWPDIAARKLEDWTGVSPPGGETWRHFTARVDHALEHVLSSPANVAIIAHLTVNAWIAHRLTGADPLRFEQRYAEVLRYDTLG